MDRVYQSNAIETPPSSVASSGSYPTAGNKASGQLATVPGPYWFYSITEEIRNAIIAAGLTPDPAQVDQLSKAMGKFLPLVGGNVTGHLTIQNKNVVRSVNGADADVNGNVNVSFPSPTAYVTETWKSSDGSKWYRKWSDGWVEQGGYEMPTSMGSMIAFPVAMKDKKYFLSAIADNQLWVVDCYKEGTEAFATTGWYPWAWNSWGNQQNGYFHWKAEGYYA